MMRGIYKYIQRVAFDNGFQHRKIRKFTCTVLSLFIYTIIIYKLAKHSHIDNNYNNSNKTLICDTFDVVYTWVNGSDPKFINSLKKYNKNYKNYDPSRYDDKNELKYSLRSLQRYAPWIRHVYIVTNGQIPHWLDVSHEKITIIQHSQLIDDHNILPTFSSSSIETFIHRIPNLSKRFLYMNDDIFLGEKLYPEDLYTQSDGVKIYNAWTLPDCANDCPWVYIGDGSCDHHCNIPECQYDGGDCVYEDNNDVNDDVIHELSSPLQINIMRKLNKTQSLNQLIKNQTLNDNEQEQIRHKYHHHHQHHEYQKKINNSHKIERHILTFNEELKRKNVTNIQQIHAFVEEFNNKQKRKRRRKHTVRNRRFLLQQQQQNNDADDTMMMMMMMNSEQKLNNYQELIFTSTKDIFSNSLINTNKILNNVYGFKTRYVLAHVGFLFDKDIINEMEIKFKNEISITRKNRFRSSNDIQFAFLYYNYLMNEKYNVSIENIFDEFDTDKSLTWSDREIRTVLAKLYQSPLDWSIIRYFEDIVTNCSKQLHLDENPEGPFSTILYERYEDSNIPTVSKYLVSKCWPLANELIVNFGKRSKYKYTVNQKRGLQSNFMMLTSNITEVAEELDKFRRSLKKFNCINDNLEPDYEEDNQFIKYLLEDFYLSIFPEPSDFELSIKLRNRFLYLDDYDEWMRKRRLTIYFSYTFSILLFIYLLYRYVCCQKQKKRYNRRFYNM